MSKEETAARTWLATGALLVSIFTAVALARAGAAEAPFAYEPVHLPTHLDSTASLRDVDSAVRACGECSGVIYVWSDRMPLSRAGIVEIDAAARSLRVDLALVRTEEVERYAPDVAAPGVEPPAFADALLSAGVLAHAPTLVVYDRGRVIGPAIFGYKTAAAYEQLVRERLSPLALRTSGGGDARARAEVASVYTPLEGVEEVGSRRDLAPGLDLGRPVADYTAVGRPGAYFRWVPGRNAVAYESGERVYILDLDDGESRVAPGYVDFVPTPDGRFFVTPGPNGVGLAFYDADDVFAALGTRRSAAQKPFFTDPEMRDQYPSVGILESNESRTVYRVLTSWFTGIAYRDYEIRPDARTGDPTVRPIGGPVAPCRRMSLSIPIMSQDGLEVAARDESTGTTKIYRFRPRGECDEVVDVGVQTGKVAWHATGSLLAFARPQMRSRQADPGASTSGIFLFDRERRRVSRVRGSEGASTLAFPDFIGDDSLIFLIPGSNRRDPSIFRLTSGLLRRGG